MVKENHVGPVVMNTLRYRHREDRRTSCYLNLRIIWLILLTNLFISSKNPYLYILTNLSRKLKFLRTISLKLLQITVSVRLSIQFCPRFHLYKHFRLKKIHVEMPILNFGRHSVKDQYRFTTNLLFHSHS